MAVQSRVEEEGAIRQRRRTEKDEVTGRNVTVTDATSFLLLWSHVIVTPAITLLGEEKSATIQRRQVQFSSPPPSLTFNEGRV